MANINPSPIKVEAKNFRIDENGNLKVYIERELLVTDVERGSGLVEATREDAADNVGEPKEGYLAEDVEFDIYFGGSKITKYTERFYYKITPPTEEAKDKFTKINVLLSRSTNNPCQDLTGNRLTSIELFYDKNASSPFNKPLYTQQVKEGDSAEPYRWTATDSNDNKFQWAQFPDRYIGSDKYFYKINFPPDDLDPTEGAGAEIGNANSDRKSCNITREVYPITLFLGPHENREDTTKAMVCSPVYSSGGNSFSRQTIEVYVLNNPNSEGFSLSEQVLYEEDGVTPIHPLQLNVFGSIQTNNFVVKLADDDVAPYYYLAESTVTTPLFKDTPCYIVGNQLGLCFVDPNEDDPIPLDDCDIVTNNLRPGSEGGPPEDKITAVCRGDEYTWNGIKWYLNEN